ncbi:MAG: hypothetical protein Q8Q39_00275, partial [bacterium]|nr:hypothetical protein [bacterium]
EIGSNATNQYQGNSRSNNPSAAGTYTITLGGTAGSSGWFLVAITGGVPVEATIAESLALSVSSIGAGSCTADDGASVTAIGTSATSVPFGTISANTFYIGCQDLVVSTNAGGGYSLATQENLPLSTAGGQSVPDTTCNSGTCSQTVSGAWTTNTVNGFGHTCADVSGNDCNSVYGDGSYFRQFADMSSGETPQPIMVSSTPSLATGRVKYRLNVSSGQGAGIYSNTISYIITATY